MNTWVDKGERKLFVETGLATVLAIVSTYGSRPARYLIIDLFVLLLLVDLVVRLYCKLLVKPTVELLPLHNH